MTGVTGASLGHRARYVATSGHPKQAVLHAPGSRHAPRTGRRVPGTSAGPLARLAADLPETTSKVLVAGLFLALAYYIGQDFLRTGRLTGLILLASEFLVVALTLVRRPAARVDRSLGARLITALAMAGPNFVRPVAERGRIDDWLTASVSACGLLIVFGGKLSLGRSFGLVPANRGVVCSGLYRVVRHPIYAGYLLTHVAFLVAHASLWNLLVLVASDTALIVRARYEERTLSRDPAYLAYLARVRWRLVPHMY